LSDRSEQVGEQDDGEHVQQVQVDVAGLYRADQVGAENVIAEYCIRDLNDTIPPSRSG
jgi:hypothetical protein